MQVGMFDMDPPPKEYQEETVPKTLRKLYEQRCQSCSQCLTRPNCGKCKVCLQNSLSGNRSTTQCCVQKMCSKIHMAEKVQECSFLPQGWMYCFEQEKENPEYGGLVIVNAANLADTSKLTHKFRSFEKASVKSHKLFSTMDANNFYQEIGITPQVVATPTSQFKIQKPSPTKIVSSPSVLEQLPAKADSWTLKELFENRCQTCANCIREKCGECYSCKRAQPGECCVRRMCIKIPADKKAQPAPFFPPDWTIIFDPTKKNRTVNSAFRKLDGLVIISPNGRRFRSIEGVKGSGSCGAFGHIDTFAFYAHVGMHMTIEESNVIDRSRMKRGINRERNLGVASKRQKLGAKFDIPIQIDAIEFPSDGSMSTVFRGIKSLSPTELYRKKCGNCVMCTREECNKCATCLLNASRTRRLKEVCLRKVRSFYWKNLLKQSFCVDVTHFCVLYKRCA